MATILEALAAFDKVSSLGPRARAYRSALTAFAEVEVESLEDISSLLTVAVAIIHAGHIGIGTVVAERAEIALRKRLEKLRRQLRV